MVDKLKHSDFFQLLKEYVKYYPKGNERCNTLQTFAVINDFSDMNTENLEMTVNDHGKPFFWSRAWARANFSASKLSYDYPLLVALEDTTVVTDPFRKKSETCYTIELVIVDKYDEECGKKKMKGCKGRSPKEIFYQTEAFMKNLFSYLSNVVYTEGRWINRAVYDFEGLTTPIEQGLGNSFAKMLKDKNLTSNFTRWKGGTDDLYGTLTLFTFCIEECDSFEYDAESKSFKVKYDGTCC